MEFPGFQVFTYNMHWIPCSLIKSLRKRVSVVCVSYSFTTLKKLMNSLTNHCLLELLSLNTLFPLICSTSDKSGLLRWIKHVSFAESLVSTPPPCARLHIWQHALLHEHFYEQLHLICMGGEKYWEKKKKKSRHSRLSNLIRLALTSRVRCV